MKYLETNKYLEIQIAIGLSLVTAIFNYYVLLVAIGVLLISLLDSKKTNFLLLLIIIGYISFTAEFYAQYRVYLTIGCSTLLFILFLKEFGLDFNTYPKLTGKVISFVSLLLITLTISTIFSSDIEISFLALLRTGMFLIISFIFYSLLKDERNIYTYIYAVLIVVLMVGLRMILDIVSLGPELYFMRVVVSAAFQLSGSLGYTGFTIFFISISLIISLYFRDNYSKSFKRYILTPLLFTNIIIIILANSRGGIIAGLISVAFFTFYLKRELLLRSIALIIVIVVLTFLLFEPVQKTVEGYLRLDTVSDREVYWNMGLQVISDNPIFGVGADMFDKQFYNYASSQHLQLFKIGSSLLGKPHPHNFFLFFTSENGILGFITAVFFFVLFLSIGFYCIKNSKSISKDYYILSVTITGIGVGLFFRTFIEISGFLTYGYITRDLPFWLMFVILLKIYVNISEHKSENTEGTKLDS